MPATDGEETVSARVRSVVLIDDHRTFADLLNRALSGEPDLECVGVAYDIDAGLELVERARPDVVVTDLRFAADQRDGVDVVRAVSTLLPGAVVVLLTGHADGVLMHRAAIAGASCLIAKDGSLPDLLQALRSAEAGGLTVHPSLLRDLAAAGRSASGTLFASLSARESDVLALLTLGMDASAIARELGISLNTCRGYIKSLLHKLGAHSQLEAVALARRHGLVDG